MSEKLKMTDGLEFSLFGAGFWRMLSWGKSNAELRAYVNALLDLGINTFDHADIYGNYLCEKKFGEILSGESEFRSKMQIVTKCGIKLVSENRPENSSHCYDTSAEHIIKSAEKSLENFNTDYLDVLLIHRLDYLMNAEETAGAFVKLREQGKVLYFGVSNFTRNQFELLQSFLPFPLVTNQIELNLFNLFHIDNGDLDYLQMVKIHPMIWSPLGGGRIYNDESEQGKRIRYVLMELKEELNAGIDQIAIAWLLKHPVKPHIILGTGNLERIRDAVNSGKINLTNEQWYRLWTASKGYDIP